MGTLGETTSRNLQAVVRAANAGGQGPALGGKYYGGYAGGSGGTFGKAPSGRGDTNPHGAATREGGGAFGGNNSAGVRPKIRPNSEGVKALWDTLPVKELPNAPAKGEDSFALCYRPGSALEPVEYQFSGLGLTPASPAPTRAKLSQRPQSAMAAPAGREPLSASAWPEAEPNAMPPYRKPYRSGQMDRCSPDAIMAMLQAGVAPQGAMSLPPLPEAGLPPASEGITREDSGENADQVAPRSGQRGGTKPLSQSMAEDLDAAEGVSVAYILRLEDEMRAALKKKRTVYEDERQILQKAFKLVDDGSGDVDASEFVRLMAKLGVSLQRAEALALFKRYGHEGRHMPYTTFVKMLLSDKSRQLATDVPMRKGAFALGDKRGGSTECKIAYRPCKKPVYTPSDWDEPGCGEAVIARSSEVPDSRLSLEFVYGYAGIDNTDSNIFYNCKRQVVYYTAGLVVVYTPPPDTAQDREEIGDGHTQHFFLGHDDDIKSLACCTADVQVDGVSYPAHAVFASGQVSSHEHGPYVAVWDSRVGSQEGNPELRRLEFPKSDRGIIALGFSPDGHFLTAVAMDNTHSVYVYDWLNRRRVSEGRGQNGEPPQVYGVTWNPHVRQRDSQVFVTWGRKHCKLWAQGGAGGGFQPTQVTFGKFDIQNVHAAAFLPHSHALVLGVARGDVLVCDGTTAIRSIAAHKPGPQFIADDGSIAYSGVRGMALHENNTLLLTAGADGTIQKWDVKDGTLSENKRGKPIIMSSPYGPGDKPPEFRALACCPLDSDFMLGSANCDIWEANDDKQEILVYGHAADLNALAWHPYREAVFATACNCARLLVFDAAAREVIKTCTVGCSLNAVAWSNTAMRDGEYYHLALGTLKGRIVVVDEETLRPVWEARDSLQGISDLKYSPDSSVLAAATFDQFIDLYATSGKRYTKIGRCNGHSATVRQIDWSRDGSVLASCCSAYEILYWNGRNGKQITRNQRDTAWHSVTLTLGFPVMGIWPENADGTDINAVDRDPSCRYVATAGDDGIVKLFNYPCVVHDAPHRAYLGHSAHVTCVRFNHAGSWLCSAGGRDRAVLQFKVLEVAKEPPPPPPPQKIWASIDGAGKQFGWVDSTEAHGGNVDDGVRKEDSSGGWRRAAMQKIDKLVLTLKRGLAGKKDSYKAAITRTLGLTRTNQSVEVPNNFEFRATARKCQHLLQIETKEEYLSRLNKQAAKGAIRPPIRVTHRPAQE